MTALDYSETDGRLAVRIRAHTEFASFQLEDWLCERIQVSKGDRVFEVGCGGGNFFPLYSQLVGARGLVVGIDVSDSLLASARRALASIEARGIVLKWDFNDRLPILDGEFACTLSLFSAYYADSAGGLVDEMIRVTSAEGQLLLLGPADDNARELYELNEAVTGVAHTEGTRYTTTRLAHEFLPELRKRLGDKVDFVVLDRRIEFPSPRDFAEYYLATWLCEKSVQQSGRAVSLEDVERVVVTTTLSKRIVAIDARLRR